MYPTIKQDISILLKWAKFNSFQCFSDWFLYVYYWQLINAHWFLVSIFSEIPKLRWTKKNQGDNPVKVIHQSNLSFFLNKSSNSTQLLF